MPFNVLTERFDREWRIYQQESERGVGGQYYESNSSFAVPYPGLTGRRHYLGVGLDGLRRREKYSAASGRGNRGGIRPWTNGYGSTRTDAGGRSQSHRHASDGGSANSHALSYYGAASRTGLDA